MATSSCWSITRPSPRATAASTSAALRRFRSGTPPSEGGKGIGSRQGLGRALEQQPRRRRQRPARPRRQAVRRVEQLPHHPGRRADHGLPQRQAGRRSRPAGELLGPQAAGRRQRADPAPDSRRRDPLAEHLCPRDPARRGQQDAGRARREGLPAGLQRQEPRRLGRPDRELRGRRRRPACKPHKGGTIYYNEELKRLRRPGRVQAAAGRQQRPGDPIPRPRRHRLCRHVRAPGPRRRRSPVRESSTRGRPTARPTAWSPPSAATSGRSASGTSRK